VYGVGAEPVKWFDVNTSNTYKGGQWLTCNAPLDIIPLFLRCGADLKTDIFMNVEEYEL